MGIIYGWLIEISAIWGVRVVLKLVKKTLLPKIQCRVTINIPDKGHILYDAVADKHIEFMATISNPTPLELTIVGGSISILNQDISFGTHTVEEVRVPRESPKYRIILAVYNPFLNPLSLPTKNERWKLKGSLKLRCYYGDWDMPINSTYFRVDCKEWEATKRLVDTEKRRLGGI